MFYAVIYCPACNENTWFRDEKTGPGEYQYECTRCGHHKTGIAGRLLDRWLA